MSSSIIIRNLDKKTMKKLLLIAIIFSIGRLSVSAQSGARKETMTPEKRAEVVTNKMSEQLDLSEAQKKQVYEINLENANKRQSEMEARRAEKKAQREEMRIQNQAQKDKVAAILNAEQKEKFLELTDQRRERMDNLRDVRQNPDSKKIRDRRKIRPDRENFQK